MECFRILHIILTIQAWEASSITNNQHVKNFRRHTGPLPPTDWELGLREAVHQALLREHHADPSLRDRLLSAPLIGRQDTATPFGDIAVLARGQIYATHTGFKFVQDPYQNDCDGCHDHGCVGAQCHPWRNNGEEKLLALWTVKRIRHRDPNYGHVFEIEYTISPLTAAINEGLVRRDGHFNYNVPGHVFVIKSDPRLNSAYYLHDNADKHLQLTGGHRNQETAVQYPQEHYKDKGNGYFKPGILIGVSPDGYKHILHSFPGFFSSYHPQTDYHQDHTTVDPKEYELYKKLIESLAAKTTQDYSNGPHRFSLTTPTHKPSMKPTTQQIIPTFIPVPETTYLQFPDGQLVPLTTNALPPSTTTKYQDIKPIRFPTTKTTTTSKPTYSQPDPFYHTLPSSTKIPSTLKPITTFHYYTPIEDTESDVVKKPTTIKQRPFKKPTTTSIKEDEEEFNLFPPTQPLSTTKKYTKTTAATPPEMDDDYELFPVDTPTESMRPVTEVPVSTQPDSINQQLPPPDEDTDTTVPYVGSTVTLPTETTRIIEQSSTIDSTESITTRRETTLKDRATTIKETTTKSLPTITTPPTTQYVIVTEEEKFPSQIPTTQFIYSTKGETFTTKQPTTQFIPSTKEETYITKVPTTQFISSSEEEKLTSKIPTTQFTTPTKQEKFTTKIPTTHYITSSNEEQLSTRIPTSQFITTTSEEMFNTIVQTTQQPSTIPSTTQPPPTKISTTQDPTTVFEYSTTKPSTEIIASTLNAQTSYYPTRESTINEISTERLTTFKIPTTTDYSTLETKPQKITTVNVFPESTADTVPDGNGDIPLTTSTTKPITPTQASDFLSDPNNTNPTSNNLNKKEFNDDDIFGEKPKTSSTIPTKATTKEVLQSDLAEALFGGRRAKQIKVTSKITTPLPTNPPKIIYSNFYVASTDPSTDITVNPLFLDGSTTELRPITDQSYSTSISFQVNKKNNDTTLHLEPTIRAELKEVVNDKSDYKIYKAELPRDTKSTSEKPIETKKVFDDIALQLVNHARTIDYLNKKPSRQPKYRRRSYTTKKKRTQRRNNESPKVKV